MIKMNNNDTIALLKFLMMEDLMKFRYNFDAIDTMQELKKYLKANPSNPLNEFEKPIAFNNELFRVYKDNQSWYYVDMLSQNKTFKCDDIKGLIEFLKYIEKE